MIIKQTCDIGYEMISLALIPSPLNFNIVANCEGHEHGMPRVTIVRKQNTITERIVDSRT